MSARLALSICALWILGCAAPAVGTLPTIAPDRGSANLASATSAPDAPVPVGEVPSARGVDTGDAVAEAPSDPGRSSLSTDHPHKTIQSTPNPTTPAPGTTGPGSKVKPISPKPAGITQVNDRSWTVTRSLVDKWQENPHALGNVQEDGEGWQLVGVRTHPDYHLGMRNGDIVLEVNGHKLNTMPNMLAAYLACKNDTKFDVVFLRSGTRLTHHYEIVN